MTFNVIRGVAGGVGRWVSMMWVIGLLGVASARAGTDVIGVYVTWLRDPATTAVVNWVNLYEGTAARVWYRAEGETTWRTGEGTRAAVAPSVLQVRRVELTGLGADTVYEFGLGEAAPTAEEARMGRVERFRTMPSELKAERPVKFVTGGDTMHRREWFEAMNRAAGAEDPDFALMGGDLAYEDGVSATRCVEWLRGLHETLRAPDGRIIPLVVAIGNHEVRGHYNGRVPEDAPYFYGLFALPEGRSYHALDFGDYLSLVMLDTDHTQPIRGAQTEWLAGALAARDGRRFLFPVYHYPAYGTTKRPKEGGLPSEHPRSMAIQREWSPLFEKHGVTAVFENDHHAYKRTHPIRAGARDDERGVVYLGDGAWGVQTRPVATPEEAWYLARSEARRHVFAVTLTEAGEATVRAIDATGEVFDRCTLKGRAAR